MSASRPPTPEVNAPVLTRINVYVPRDVSAETWASVAPLVRAAVTAVGAPTPDSATALMGVATRFAVWCWGQGLLLDAEVVFTPDRVEDYLARPPRPVNKDAASRLRRIGRAATTKAPWDPPRPKRRRRPRTGPYTPVEIAALRDWAAAQPTQRLREIATAILVLGLAFGLTPVELRAANKDDVVDNGHVVLIRIGGHHPRTVPALAAQVHDVREVVCGLPPGARLVPGCERIDNTLNKLKHRKRRPRLVVMRLRTTWQVDLLRAGASVPEFLDLAGLDTTAILADLAPYLPRRPDRELRRALGVGSE